MLPAVPVLQRVLARLLLVVLSLSFPFPVLAISIHHIKALPRRQGNQSLPLSNDALLPPRAATLPSPRLMRSSCCIVLLPRFLLDASLPPVSYAHPPVNGPDLRLLTFTEFLVHGPPRRESLGHFPRLNLPPIILSRLLFNSID